MGNRKRENNKKEYDKAKRDHRKNQVKESNVVFEIIEDLTRNAKLIVDYSLQSQALKDLKQIEKALGFTGVNDGIEKKLEKLKENIEKWKNKNLGNAK